MGFDWRQRKKFNQKLGSVVKLQREGRGLSFRKAGKIIGISHSYLCRIEKGKASPSAVVVFSLMQFCKSPKWKGEFINDVNTLFFL